MPKQWELTVDGRLENLSTIADFVVKAAQASGLDEKAIFEVQLAVDEACTNVIEHSYRGEDKGEIALRCERAEGGFVVTIRDHGQPFNPEDVPLPDLKCGLDKRQQRAENCFGRQNIPDPGRRDQYGRHCFCLYFAGDQ